METKNISIEPSLLFEKIDKWVDSFFGLIPNIIIASLFVAITIGVSLLVSSLFYRRFEKRGRHDLGVMIKGLIKWSILIVGILFAATIVIPSLKLGEIIGGLGIGSVAIGFAFKDILQNWLSGFLILLRQPFEIGDQIEINGYVGTVKHIQTRSTLIKTYDGQRVVIPNSEIYTNVITVKTAYRIRRSHYDVGVGYGDNLDQACDIIKNTIINIEGVEKDPEPQVFPWDLAASWVTIRIRWWTDSRRSDVVNIRSHIILNVKKSLDEAGIDMPFDTQVLLMHDQTEESDGDRSNQREGWPSHGEETKPRWVAKEERKSKTK